MPQLSVLVESYNAGLPSWSSAIRVRSVEDLVRALEPSPDAMDPELQLLVAGFLEAQGQCDGLDGPFQQDALEFRTAAASGAKVVCKALSVHKKVGCWRMETTSGRSIESNAGGASSVVKSSSHSCDWVWS